MSYMLRLPEINAVTDREKLQQIKSYLYQMTQELNFALESVDKSQKELVETTVASASKAVKDATTPQKTFAAVRDLIIKNAEIVEAYYETINMKLSGVYVAQSDFGTYTQETQALIEANSQSITQNYASQQAINSQLSEDISAIMSNAYIKTGLLDEIDGREIYGVEIGQTTKDQDGNSLYARSARFTPSALEFYDGADPNGTTPIAYISNKQLFITDAEITGSLTIAGFEFKKTASGNFRLSLK